MPLVGSQRGDADNFIEIFDFVLSLYGSMAGFLVNIPCKMCVVCV